MLTREAATNLHITAVLLLVLLFGCSQQRRTDTIEPWYPAVNDSGDSLYGVFEGRIPCTAPDLIGCDKVKVALVLYRGNDAEMFSSYRLARVYVAVEPQGSRSVVGGSVSLTRGTALHADATVLQLDAHAPPELQRYWMIGNDILFLLDDDLQPKVGTAGWSYVLNRTR